MAFFLKAIGLSDDIPGFPFTLDSNDPGRVVYTSPLMCWTVRRGTPRDDALKKISIFTCTFASSTSGNNELVKLLARNAMRRAKSLMIPGFLKCFGATEYRDAVYIATELCLSLKDVLESKELRTQLYGTAPDEYYASVAYGVSTVGEALSSLHQNRLVHGNVNCQSIFVSPSSGVWRLSGLELVSSLDEMGANEPSGVFDSARRAGVLEGYRCPPELSQGGGGGGGEGSSGGSTSNTDAFAIDAWGLACLLYETVGVTVVEAVDGKLSSLVHTLASGELRNACRQRLPKSLHSGCAGITAANPRLRKSVQAFLEHCEFVKDSTFVQFMKGLSEALLLDVTQQVRLIESLADVVDTFPLRPCLCCVLPRLGELIRAAAKPGSANGAAGVSIGPVVAPVLKMAARTSAGEDFDNHVTPVLVQMYQCPDTLMRYKLLLGAEVYGGKLSSAALNNAIWPLYVKGFQYSTPSVREYSARALVHLAPHMSQAVLGDQVPKALGLLQRDHDGALRANATIALHLVSGYITPPTQRASVVLNYCRPMLRDAFEPSRVAALRSLRGAIDYLSAKQLAEAVLPAVAPLTVDQSSEESRGAALALIKAAMGKLEENHKHLTAQQPAVPGPASASSTSAKPAPLQPAAVAAEGSNNGASMSSNVSSSLGSPWGWGIFSNSTSPSPPASTSPASVATVRHADAVSVSASPATAAVVSGELKAGPLPSSVSVPIASQPPVTTLPAPVVGGGSGWSDEDDVGASSAGGSAVKTSDGWDDDDNDDDDAGAVVKPTATVKATSLGLASGTVGARVRPAGFRATTNTTASTTITFGAAAKPFTASAAVHNSSNPSAFSASPLPASPTASTVSGGSTPMGGSGSPTGATARANPSGPMKLRKKGGLGAARLE
jgi:SCY1-like protein 1